MKKSFNPAKILNLAYFTAFTGLMFSLAYGEIYLNSNYYVNQKLKEKGFDNVLFLKQNFFEKIASMDCYRTTICGDFIAQKNNQTIEGMILARRSIKDFSSFFNPEIEFKHIYSENSKPKL